MSYVSGTPTSGILSGEGELLITLYLSLLDILISFRYTYLFYLSLILNSFR